MNGRLYDPLVSRFLSPDPYVQDHTSTLDYNRYAYCLNNPLKYTDPSGNSAYKDYMDATYGEGNYYYRGDAPGSWGPYNRNGGGGINGYSNNFGRSISSGATSYEQWASKKNAETTWIQLGFYYRDEKGNPTTKDGLSGDFWTFEATMHNFPVNTTRGYTSNWSVAAGQGGGERKYSGAITDVITAVGGSSSVYSNFPAYRNPIINKHYTKLSPKYGTPFGVIGNIGDGIATIGAVYNLKIDPYNPESYADMATAILGWWPVVGDINAILYMGAKDQVYQIQENINNNVNPLRNVYVPATGDVLWW